MINFIKILLLFELYSDIILALINEFFLLLILFFDYLWMYIKYKLDYCSGSENSSMLATQVKEVSEVK